MEHFRQIFSTTYLSITAIIISLLSTGLPFDQPVKSKAIVSEFRLKNIDGKMLSLKDFPKAKGFIIIFTCNHCPFARLYPARLNELNLKFKPLDVPLIAISSTDTISYEEDTYVKMIAKSKAEKFNFPYLYDGSQTVARNFKAQKTPHAYVIWKERGKWVVRYNGAIDDNGAEPKDVQHQYVADAVKSLLSAKPIKVNETRSIGCQINFRNL